MAVAVKLILYVICQHFCILRRRSPFDFWCAVLVGKETRLILQPLLVQCGSHADAGQERRERERERERVSLAKVSIKEEQLIEGGHEGTYLGIAIH